MLTYLAARDPAMLHTLGITAEFVKRESARAAAAAKWRSMEPGDKRAVDEATWRTWLVKYMARLGREKRAGALDEQRRALMNRSNPRIVLRNWVRRSVNGIDIQWCLARLSQTGRLSAPSGQLAASPIAKASACFTAFAGC